MEDKRILNIFSSWRCILSMFFTSLKTIINDHITAILTCWDTNRRSFLKKKIFLKTVTTSSIPSNSFLYLRKYFINQNDKYFLMISKDRSFCDQNLQFVMILHNQLKIFIFIFSILILLFSKILSIVIFHSPVANLLTSLKCTKSYNSLKI